MTECPTCGNPLKPEGGPGPATSRVDNETLVCANCGELEALLDIFSSWKKAVKIHWRVSSAVRQMRGSSHEISTSEALG